MQLRRTPLWILGFSLSLLTLTSTPGLSASNAGAPATKTGKSSPHSTSAAQPNSDVKRIMHGIFGSIQLIMPLSLDTDKFSKPQNKKLIMDNLQNLMNNAGSLASHSTKKDSGFQFLSASLESDARMTYNLYKEGNYGEARFYIHNLTEACISCHSKLPSQKEFPSAQDFFSKVEIQSLPLQERIWFQIVTRQFDKASADFEKLFDQRDFSVAELLRLNTFSDYLKIQIRVKQDYDRPHKFLSKLKDRPGTPDNVKAQVAYLITSLEDAKANLKGSGTELERARAIVEKAQKQQTDNLDDKNLIYYVAASGLLNQYLAKSPTNREDMANAYYLLGLTESLIGRSFWVSEIEYFWETAIRTAPSSPWAAKSLKSLEDYVTLEFSGSSGVHVPEDYQALIKELKTLVASAKSKK